MNRGYIKLWRKSLDAGWIKNHKLWVFWTYCLLKASYKEFDAIVGLQVVHLLPGQFIFGLLVASKETGLSIRQIRTIIDFLRKTGNLTIKTTNKFSIISIVNWHIYQPQENENDTLNDKQVANKGQHTRSKEVKRDIASSKNKDASLPSQEKKTDPRVKTLIDYFFQTCKEVKGFEPAINGKDGKIVKEILKDSSEDTLKSVISFFLDNKKADEVGITLSTALSAHTINLYKQAWQKSKWQYGDEPEPLTDRKWWA